MAERLFDPAIFQRTTFQDGDHSGVFDPAIFQNDTFQQTVPDRLFQRGIFQALVFQDLAGEVVVAPTRTAPPPGAIQFTPAQEEDDDGIAAMLAALVRPW